MGRKFSTDDLQNTQEKMLQDYMEVAQQKLNVRQKMQLYTSTSTTSQSDLERDSGSATTSDLNLNSNHSSASNLARQQLDPETLKLDVNQTRCRIESLKAELNNNVRTYLNTSQDLNTGGPLIPAPHNPARPDPQQQQRSAACGVNCGLGMPCKLCNSDPHFAAMPPSFLHRDSNNFQQNNDMVERLCVNLEALLRPNNNNLHYHHTAHPHEQHRLETMDSISARQSSYPETSFPAHNKLPGKNLSETSLLKMMYISEKEKLEKLKKHLTLIENETDSEVMGNDKERILLMQRKDKLLKEFKKIISHKSSQEEIDMVNRNIQSLERDLQGALESSNKTISDRIKLQNEKTKIMKELQTSMEEIAKIEEKLKKTSNLEIGESGGATEEETLTPKHKYVKREPWCRQYDSSPSQYHQLYLELLQKERELQHIYQSLLINRGISSDPTQSSRHQNDKDHDEEKEKDIIPQIYVSHYNDPITSIIPSHTHHVHVNSNPTLNHPCLSASRYEALYQIANRYLSSSSACNGGNALLNGESELNPDSSYAQSPHGGSAPPNGQAYVTTLASTPHTTTTTSIMPHQHSSMKNGGGIASSQAPKSKTITECYAFV